jgi:catalase
MIRKSDNRHELTDVLNAHGGYQQHMSAAFQYNLKRCIERQLAHFEKVHPDYAAGVRAALSSME